MTIGTITCVNGCSFRVMRSYLTRFQTTGVQGTPVITGSSYFWAAAFWPIDVTITFLPAFHPWNAGAFQLSAILVESYYQHLPDPTQIPLDVQLSYIPPTSLAAGPAIKLFLAGNVNDPIFHQLPPADQPYWRNGDEP